MMWRANVLLEVLFFMSWVCAELTQQNTVKSTFLAKVNRRLARKGRVKDGYNNEPFLNSESTEDEHKIYVPNWKYFTDSKATDEKGMKSHFNQPLYHCGHESISIRLHFIRLADFYLVKGALPPLSLRMLPKECHHLEMKQGPWLLIRLPYQGCYLTQWIDGEVRYHSISLLYFDRLLMKNVTGNAICQTPTTSLTSEVSCGKKSMTVKLPAGTQRTMRVLGPQAQDGYNVSLIPTTDALFVNFTEKVKTEYDGMSLQLVYQNFAGEMSTVKMSCSSRHHKSRRFTRGIDQAFLDLWEFQDIALEADISDETSEAESSDVEYYDSQRPSPTKTIPKFTPAPDAQEDLYEFEYYGFKDLEDMPIAAHLTLAPQTPKPAYTATLWPSITNTDPTCWPTPELEPTTTEEWLATTDSEDLQISGSQEVPTVPHDSVVVCTGNVIKHPATTDPGDFEICGSQEVPNGPQDPVVPCPGIVTQQPATMDPGDFEICGSQEVPTGPHDPVVPCPGIVTQQPATMDPGDFEICGSHEVPTGPHDPVVACPGIVTQQPVTMDPGDFEICGSQEVPTGPHDPVVACPGIVTQQPVTMDPGDFEICGSHEVPTGPHDPVVACPGIVTQQPVTMDPGDFEICGSQEVPTGPHDPVVQCPGMVTQQPATMDPGDFEICGSQEIPTGPHDPVVACPGIVTQQPVTMDPGDFEIGGSQETTLPAEPCIDPEDLEFCGFKEVPVSPNPAKACPTIIPQSAEGIDLEELEFCGFKKVPVSPKPPPQSSEEVDPEDLEFCGFRGTCLS